MTLPNSTYLSFPPAIFRFQKHERYKQCEQDSNILAFCLSTSVFPKARCVESFSTHFGCLYFVSSKPPQILQLSFNVCFMCLYWALANGVCAAYRWQKKENPVRDPYANGNGNLLVYARLEHIKSAMHRSD